MKVIKGFSNFVTVKYRWTSQFPIHYKSVFGMPETDLLNAATLLRPLYV